MDRRRVFGATDHRLPEQLSVREYESFPADLRVIMPEMVFPLAPKPVFRKKPVEKILDALGCFVERARLPAAGFLVAFLERHTIFTLK